jgi:hypothetical protein
MTPPTKKGIRHPHSGIKDKVQKNPIKVPITPPRKPEAHKILPAKASPTFFAYSITKIEAPLYSPPTHNPCSKRHITKMIGAAIPI